MSRLPGDTASPGWIRPRFHLLGKEWIGFQVCGVAGLCASLAVAMAAARAIGLSLPVVLAILAAGVATFLALAMATKIVAGEESLIYYHHEIAVIAAATLLLKATGQPVLPYLDITALGIGTFLAFGRAGCLMAGCCHGRPSGWGVRYGQSHVREGLPHCYSGVRLLPVQALESLFVLGTVAAGAWILRSSAPGAVFSSYVVVYGAARFGFEIIRGDTPRRYWHGFSEAQWTSVLLISGAVLAEWRGRLPISWFHTGLLATAIGLMLVLAAARRPESELSTPRHLCELASAFRSLARESEGIEVRRTSLGILVSGELVGSARLCSFSRAGRPLNDVEALVLARLIGSLALVDCSQSTLNRGAHNVFHLMLEAPPMTPVKSPGPPVPSRRPRVPGSRSTRPPDERGISSTPGPVPDFIDDFEWEVLRDPAKRQLLDPLCMGPSPVRHGSRLFSAKAPSGAQITES